MKVNLTEDRGWKRTLEIELPAEKVDEQFDLFQEKYRKKAKIKGFRPGKAPLEIVKEKYKDAIARDVLDSLIPKIFQDAIKQTNLSPITVPIVKELDFDYGKPLKVKAELEVIPEFEPKDYQGVKLVRKVSEITEKEVERALDYLREKNAQLRAVERESKSEDFLVLDLERTMLDDQKKKPEKFTNQLVQLGSQNIFKEFQEGLEKTKAKDQKKIELTYAQDYFEKKLAGKKAHFNIEVKEVKEKVLPELNDDFAKSLGDYQDLNQLKNRIKEDLERKAKEDSETRLKSDLIQKIVEVNSFEVPGSMVQRYLDAAVNDFKKQYDKVDEEKIREQYRSIGTDRIRWNLIYHRLAEKEKMDTEPQEIEEWTKAFAKNYNLEINKAKEFLAKNREIENIKDTILEEKVLNYLLGKAEITEEKIKPAQGEKTK
ncbi:MAG TPA: trigger factor [candidate division Zixibacteria bacterium]